MADLERTRATDTHPSDQLRVSLRQFGQQIATVKEAIDDARDTMEEQRSLRAESITAKVKAERTHQAIAVLENVRYERCPECGTDISARAVEPDHCRLCSSVTSGDGVGDPAEVEALRRDLNERIDQIADSIARRQDAIERLARQLK